MATLSALGQGIVEQGIIPNLDEIMSLKVVAQDENCCKLVHKMLKDHRDYLEIFMRVADANEQIADVD